MLRALCRAAHMNGMETNTEATITPIESGALARITHDSAPQWQDCSYKSGKLIMIEDYVSAAIAEDGVAFYWASSHRTDNINDVTIDARHVELVKSRAQLEGRTIPTRAQILDALGTALLCDGEGFTVSEANKDTEHFTIECAGTTDDGLHFAFELTVPEPHETDF